MKKIVSKGIGYGIGSSLMARMGSKAPPGVARNINTAMEIGSIEVPIEAAGMVMKQTESMMVQKRKKRPARKGWM